VLAQAIGTPGQYDVQAAGAFDQADQHGCFTQCGIGWNQPDQFMPVPAGFGGWAVQWVQCAPGEPFSRWEKVPRRGG